MNLSNRSSDIPAVSPRERALVALHLGREANAKDIALLTDSLDIEHCNQAELLILSCIGYEQGWKSFPKPIVPRLKGLHRYYQVHNTCRIPWLIEKIRALRKADIPVILLKGLAFRFHYAPQIPRIMGDYDIAVPEDRYDDAIRALQNNEDPYLGHNCPHHGIIEGKDRRLEVHCWIFKHHGEKGSDIWDRAVLCDFYGEEVYVLCPEDSFLHLLDNRAKDLFEYIFPHRTLLFLCDCCRLLDIIGSPDLRKLAVRAKTLHVSNSARRMLLFLADAFPDLISKEEVNREFPPSGDYYRWVRAGLKLQQIAKRWQSHRYRPHGPLTPLRTARALPYHFALYHVRKLEMEEAKFPYSFWQFCTDIGGSESFGGLVKKYGSRLRLFARRPEGSA